jgi:hypothetical protein
MRYKKGDITYIKVKDQLIQVVINKEVKPYHGKSYYTKGEIRYFVSSCKKTPTEKEPMETFLKSYLESDMISWEREYKLKSIL